MKFHLLAGVVGALAAVAALTSFDSYRDAASAKACGWAERPEIFNECRWAFHQNGEHGAWVVKQSYGEN